MLIWLIQIGERLPISEGVRKMRTSFLAKKLVQRGHSVVWWSSAFDHFEKKWISSAPYEVEGVRLILLRGCGYTSNVSIRRYLDHRIVAHRFRQQSSVEALPDVIVASLPSHDLAYEAVCFGLKKKVPVLVDIRDPWPDVFFSGLSPLLQFGARTLLGWDSYLLKKSIRGASSVLACTDYFLEWAFKRSGRPKGQLDRVFPLGGEPFSVRSIVRRVDSTQPFVVFFVGTFSSFHNPEILVECARKMKTENVRFVIAGDGVYRERLREMAKGLANVEFPGWLNDKEIKSYLVSSHVGVCPSNRPTALFPNKAFTYLSAGLPILTSFEGDLRLTVEKERIGLYYPPRDTQALCTCIRLLKGDGNLYEGMSNRAGDVFESRYKADSIYESYSNHVEMVAKTGLNRS